jgi:hypothetical protein
LWRLHIYRYVLNPKLVYPLYYSFYLSPFLMVISTSLNVPYPYCIESTSTMFTFFYPPPLISALPFAWPVLHSCSSLFSCLFVVHWDICLGIFPVNVLSLYCLSQCHPSTLLFHTFSPHPVSSISFQCGSFCLAHTQMWHILLLLGNNSHANGSEWYYIALVCVLLIADDVTILSAHWPLGYLLWRNIYSNPLPVFNLAYFCLVVVEFLNTILYALSVLRYG